MLVSFYNYTHTDLYVVLYTLKLINKFINPPTFGTFFIQVDAPFETIRILWFRMVK